MAQCLKQGCCYRPVPYGGVPFCFNTTEDDGRTRCDVPGIQRRECGYLHITKEKCLANPNCCWAPSPSASGIPWCYGRRTGPRKQGHLKRIACVGASITAGNLLAYTHRPYPTYLQDLLGTDDYIVGNFGADGATVLKTGTHRHDVSAWYGRSIEFRLALDFKPDIVIMQFADNDSRERNWDKSAPERFVQDYIFMANVFKNLSSKPVVYLMRPPPLYVDYRYGGMSMKVSNELIPRLLEKVKEACRLPKIIDVYTTFAGHCPLENNTRKRHDCEWIATNNQLPVRPGFEGVHPTDEGNAVMAKVVRAALQQAPRAQGPAEEREGRPEPAEAGERREAREDLDQAEKKRRSKPERVRRVACIGASITAGDLAIYTTKSYPSYLQELLGFDGWMVGNFGADGSTALKTGIHHQSLKTAWYCKTVEFQQAVDFKPDVVIMQFVDNDSRECNWKDSPAKRYVEDYIYLVDIFRNLSSRPTVYLMRPSPLYVDGRYGGMSMAVSNELIPHLLEEVREARRLPPVINVFSAFTDQCPLKENTRTRHNCGLIATNNQLPIRPGFEGVHPTNAGNQLMAKTVEAAMAKLLKGGF